MNKEIRNRLDQLPDDIRDCSLGDPAEDAIYAIWQEHIGDNDAKLDMLKDIIGLVYLKEIRIEDLAKRLREILGFDEAAANASAALILANMFYPVKTYYPGVEEEIIKLGGQLPQAEPEPEEAMIKKDGALQQFTNREEEISDMLDKERQAEEEKKKDMVVYGKIEDLIARYPELGDLVIGMQDSISIKDMPDMKPMLKYWIQDYKDKVGIYRHTNMDRVQYICHDRNTRSMNEEERRQLNLVVKSVDGEIELPYSTKTKKIDFTLIQDE